MVHRITLSAGMLTLLVAATLSAQSPTKPSTNAHHQATSPVKPVATTKKIQLHESQPGLIAMATVPVNDALKTATSEYSGKLVSERIERRKDQLVYVFGIRGKKGLEHIMVDAKTGKLIASHAEAKKTTHKKG